VNYSYPLFKSKDIFILYIELAIELSAVTRNKVSPALHLPTESTNAAAQLRRNSLVTCQPLERFLSLLCLKYCMFVRLHVCVSV
jgi:hypothetical protein